MKIYIASSWKNQHAVEMLTALLREKGHEVLSFVENNYGEGHSAVKPMDFEKWVKTEQAQFSFNYDTGGAMNSDLVIYISPSGKDAAAEVGMAYAKGVPIIGLFAKGEDFGLMRKMMKVWCERYPEVIDAVEKYGLKRNPYACYGNQRPHPMDFEDAGEFRQRFKMWEEWEENNLYQNAGE